MSGMMLIPMPSAAQKKLLRKKERRFPATGVPDRKGTGVGSTWCASPCRDGVCPYPAHTPAQRNAHMKITRIRFTAAHLCFICVSNFPAVAGNGSRSSMQYVGRALQ